jgi:hypothetical protein
MTNNAYCPASTTGTTQSTLTTTQETATAPTTDIENEKETINAGKSFL